MKNLLISTALPTSFSYYHKFECTQAFLYLGIQRISVTNATGSGGSHRIASFASHGVGRDGMELHLRNWTDEHAVEYDEESYSAPAWKRKEL